MPISGDYTKNMYSQLLKGPRKLKTTDIYSLRLFKIILINQEGNLVKYWLIRMHKYYLLSCANSNVMFFLPISLAKGTKIRKDIVISEAEISEINVKSK